MVLLVIVLCVRARVSSPLMCRALRRKTFGNFLSVVVVVATCSAVPCTVEMDMRWANGDVFITRSGRI